LSDGLDFWAKARLERATRLAEETDSPVEWQRLRDLAAAYHCDDLALEAHAHLPRPAAPPPSSRSSTTTPRPGARVVPPEGAGIQIRIRSRVPQARAAWLERWAAARGGALEAGPAPDLVVLRLPPTVKDLQEMLGGQPELVRVGNGE